MDSNCNGYNGVCQRFLGGRGQRKNLKWGTCSQTPRGYMPGTINGSGPVITNCNETDNYLQQQTVYR